jgi:SAM-dependent methyltransferase
MIGPTVHDLPAHCRRRVGRRRPPQSELRAPGADAIIREPAPFPGACPRPKCVFKEKSSVMPRVDAHSFYADCLAQYGETPEGLHFQSVQTQLARFQVLRRLLPETLSPLTIADVGCGFGDLYVFFDNCGELPGRYIGLDIHERMVDTARRRTGAEILLCDALQEALPQADYYVCSGAMNTLTLDETRLFIERCYQASRLGFLFNLLHGHDWSMTYNYRKPREIREWAAELGADIEIVDGYLFEDFTVKLTRPQPG